jgi:hypothetical protein
MKSPKFRAHTESAAFGPSPVNHAYPKRPAEILG